MGRIVLVHYYNWRIWYAGSYWIYNILGSSQENTMPNMQIRGGKMSSIMPIEIDRMRHIKFDLNAMMDLEASIGRTLTQATMPLNPMMSSISTTVNVLWAGLKWEDPKLSTKDAGNLAQEWTVKSGGNYGDLNDVLLRALIDAGWLQESPSEQPEGDGQGEVSEASEN